jgi:hypothetical protein
MKDRKSKLFASLLAIAIVSVVSCAESEPINVSLGTGGSTGSGGATGFGGTVGSGGATGDGGSTGSGGNTGSGGSNGSGGVTGSGGNTGSGGTIGTGGSTGKGGATGTGGAAGKGGTTGTGGTIATGGTTGGSKGSGGTVGTGGQGGSSTASQYANYATVQQIVSVTCGGGSCHNSGQAPNLFPSTGTLYSTLTTTKAPDCNNYLLVNPGNPSQSAFYLAISAMCPPKVPQMPNGGPYLSSDYITGVQQWIANGAPQQ